MLGNILLSENKSGSLAGNLLIATPVVQDSCFARSVIYMCAHNEAGAMGVIINYPVENIELKEIFEQLSIDTHPQTRNFPIHFGGPVEANRGFIIHSADYKSGESLICKNGVAVTASLSVLQEIAMGKGPDQGMLVLGYAGWGAGQLEAEIESGSWIVAPANETLIFGPDNETKWNLAVSTLGIDMGHFSTTVGHA